MSGGGSWKTKTRANGINLSRGETEKGSIDDDERAKYATMRKNCWLMIVTLAQTRLVLDPDSGA